MNESLTIIYFEILFTILSVSHVIVSPLFAPHDMYSGMTISDMEVTSKKGCIVYLVSLVIHIMGCKLFYRLCLLCRCSCICFCCWNNTHLNIKFKLLFMMHHFRGSLKLSHVIKTSNIELAQFWCRPSRNSEMFI